MALLKDLIVNGSSRFIGDAYFQTIKEGVWNGTRLTKDYVPSTIVYTDAKNVITGTGADADSIVIQNTSSTNPKAWIVYKYSSTLLGRMGIGTISDTVTPYWIDKNSNSHIIYHDGNLPSNSATASKWANDTTIKVGNSEAKPLNADKKLEFTLAEIGAPDTWREITVNNESIGKNTLNIMANKTIEGNITTIDATNTWRTVMIGDNDIGSSTLSIVAGSGITVTGSDGTATIKVDDNCYEHWNSVYNWYTAMTQDDTDNTINTWNEVVKFLENYDENDTLNSLMNGKLSVTDITTATSSNKANILNGKAFYSVGAGLYANTTGAPKFDGDVKYYALTSVDAGIAFDTNGNFKILNESDGWYNVLTSDNSSISDSAIKINGSTINISTDKDSNNKSYLNYVKKNGDTMTGQLTIVPTGESSPLIIKGTEGKYARIGFYAGDKCTGFLGMPTANSSLLRYDNNGSGAYTILDTYTTNYVEKYSDGLQAQMKNNDNNKYGAKINDKIINLVENANALYTDNTSDNTDYLFAFTTVNTGYKKSFVHSDFKFKHTSDTKAVTLGGATFTYNSTTGALEITTL